MSQNALEGTLIITDLKRNSFGRTEISEYTPPPISSGVYLKVEGRESRVNVESREQKVESRE